MQSPELDMTDCGFYRVTEPGFEAFHQLLCLEAWKMTGIS